MTSSPKHSPPTVLYAEDNAASRMALAELLREQGFRVLEAGTGREALRLADKRPDLVLLDVHLPDADGLELCRRLKESLAAGSPLVLLISGVRVAAEDRVQGLEGGADGYLVKPVEPAEVLATINALLRVRRAEAERRRSADLLRAVVEATTDAVFVKDRDGRYLLFNPGASRFVGKAAEEVLGKDDTELFGPESARLVMERDRRVMQSGAGSTEEEELTADGVTRIYLATKAPFCDEHGNVVGLVGISHDITERKQAEAALRRSEEMLQRAEAMAHVASWTYSADDGVVLASEEGRRLFGWASGPHRLEDLTAIVHPDDRPRVLAAMQAALTGAPFETELRIVVAGEVKWVHRRVEPETDAAGRVIRLIGVSQDVTDRRRLEEQFRQAQKMEAVGQLAGGVAHDFNNLLQVITGYGELLLGRLQADDPTHELVGEMTKAGERAAGLTRQLLAFCRQSVLAPRVLSLNSVVIDLEKMLRRVIGEDIDLGTDLRPGLASVKADPGQIEQVVMNLAVNARDAMPQGGKLTIETREAELDDGYARLHNGVRPGSYVLLAVSDTGHGMTPEVQRRIFEPFFTTKEKGQGTGLGLATVFGIIQQAGGHVAVYSELGVGTTFKVYLPRVEDAARPTSPRSAASASPQGTETVLLVEDEDAVRTLTRIVLGRAGYRVLEAADGGEALAVAGGHTGPIHLLLSDVVMPVLGGRHLAERLVVLHPEMKVLFQSGYTDDAVVRHGVLQEKVHFLQKPYTPAALAQKVREVLDSEE